MLKDKYEIDNWKVEKICIIEKCVTNKGLLFIKYQITFSNYRARQKGKQSI